MRLAVVGHSLAHLRQQKFFKQVAALGVDVLLICPERWGSLRPKPFKMRYEGTTSGTFELAPLPVLGAPDMYHYSLPTLETVLKQWWPDTLYIQQEVACAITAQCLDLANACRFRPVVFAWENLDIRGPEDSLGRRVVSPERAAALLDRCAMVIAGNDRASRLHRRPGSPEPVILPQVGVDVDHFSARPEVERKEDVGFFGRPVPEKGIHYLQAAWPTVKITGWTDWEKLPWPLSQIKVVVTFSQDTPFWSEQAMPFASVEAMACGAAVVTSDAGAIPYWMGGGYCEKSPAIIVPQASPEKLRAGILEALDQWQARGVSGRAWVDKHLSSVVIAKRLIEVLKP